MIRSKSYYIIIRVVSWNKREYKDSLSVFVEREDLIFLNLQEEREDSPSI